MSAMVRGQQYVDILEALKQCQAILARITGPEGDKDDIQHTWAACVAAELKARKALKAVQS